MGIDILAAKIHARQKQKRTWKWHGQRNDSVILMHYFGDSRYVWINIKISDWLNDRSVNSLSAVTAKTWRTVEQSRNDSSSDFVLTWKGSLGIGNHYRVISSIAPEHRLAVHPTEALHLFILAMFYCKLLSQYLK